jgi:hypothetical protein
MTKKTTKQPELDDLSFLADATPNQPEPEATKPEPKPEPVPEPVPMPVIRPEPPPVLAKAEVIPAPTPIRFGPRGFEPDTFEAVQRLSRFYLAGDALPKSTMAGARDATAVLARIGIILERGKALGLPAGTALESITIINGRVCLWGDAMLGIVLAHADCEGVECIMQGTGDDRFVVCTAYRRGRKVSPSRFGVADAKRAGLWGRSGPWSSYPDRMLQARARGFALRDTWADVLTGIKPAEEVLDYDENRNHAEGHAELMERLRAG